MDLRLEEQLDMKRKTNASRIIWNWRQEKGEKERQAQLAKDRLHGAIQGMIGLGVGVLVFLFWHRILSYFIFAIAGLVSSFALFSTAFLYQYVKKAVTFVSYWIGTAVTWLLLLPFYYLFFTPFHFLFRLGKKDTMERALDKDAATYWRDRAEPSEETYERQF